MTFPEIAKLIVGILFALEAIFTLAVYKFKFFKILVPYTYLLTIINFIAIFTYLSLDETLFVAENEGSTYFILLGVNYLLQIIGFLIEFFIRKKQRNENDILIEEKKD